MLKPYSKMTWPPKIYNANLKVPAEVMHFHIEMGESHGNYSFLSTNPQTHKGYADWARFMWLVWRGRLHHTHGMHSKGYQNNINLSKFSNKSTMYNFKCAHSTEKDEKRHSGSTTS
jgi:hypothetical protein